MLLQILLTLLAGWMPRHQPQVMTYLPAENRLRKAHRGGRRPRLTDTDRRHLAAFAHPLGRTRLQEVATIALPETLLRWYRRLIAEQFDGSTWRQPLGRPRVGDAIAPLVGRMAEEHPTWGYRRIQGALVNLGQRLDAITGRNLLRRHHLEPAPPRCKAGLSWRQFLKIHWDVLAATDLVTVDVATWHGLVPSYVVVVMERSTRRVQRAGSTPHPTEAFMTPCARQLTAPFGGCLLDTRYLRHDRDEKCVHGFDRLRRTGGVEPVVFPPRRPHLNADCERVVRSIREEALNQIMVIGEGARRCVIQSYLTHYHHERNHQGLGNQLMVPESGMEHQGGFWCVESGSVGY